MSKNDVKLVLGQFEKQYLEHEIDSLLALLGEEYEIAGTHAQRNNYQAVIRIKLQALLIKVVVSRSPDEKNDRSEIPF